ncbi:uncharacterized protein LOC105255915 [Camponotus floridanus]|uniref:uncharacterized protein LOC105255915 n=1 Tax=Camponotus floridanus TaxID=104421 RepID=UPI00059BA5D0|nr:uncharacterized protein LOC105255915 [Camponotus floridanus]
MWVSQLTYNYMMICGQVFSDDEKTSHIGINNETRIIEKECVLASSMDLYVKHRCPKNMNLYPVENEINVWICECKSGFMYFPLDDSCYEAYKQGPCPSKNYLVLPENETLPRCVENPFLEDGMVPYNGTCYLLKTLGPCEPGQLLDVHETTFQLKCIQQWAASFIGTLRRDCPSGSLRSLKSEACIKIPDYGISQTNS